MKKTILLIVLFFNLIPQIDNGNISFNLSTEAYAQDWAVEYDQNGNFYFPIDNGDLPDDDGTEVQGDNMMCVFKSIEVVSGYFGGDLDQWNVAADYSDIYNLQYNEVIAKTGVSTGNMESFLSNYFYVNEISGPIALQQSIDNGYPSMGTIRNGNGSLHEVVIVSCDIGGTVEYYDVGTGHYASGNTGVFEYIYEVQPKP